jgi:AmmeMemoRadiSam system protein A
MPCSTLELSERGLLLDIASRSIGAQLDRAVAAQPEPASLPAALREPRASFVTLTSAGLLRGCCGTLEPRHPLVLDVWHNARASAFGDPRFPPLEAEEWPSIDIEVSVLSALEPIPAEDEQRVLSQIEPRRHGLVLAWGEARGTFLPKVWEQIDSPREFLEHLKAKAGWPRHFWTREMRAWRYETEVFSRAHQADTGRPGTG